MGGYEPDAYGAKFPNRVNFDGHSEGIQKLLDEDDSSRAMMGHDNSS